VAGSLRLLRQFIASGKTDGTELAMISRSLALNAVTDPANADFDPAALKWIVRFSNFPTYCIATVESGVTTLDEMLSGDFVIGSAGRDNTYILSSAISNALGGDFNLVTGFSGAAEVNLAMARGEVDGTCGRSFGSMERLAAIVDFVVIAELSPISFGLIDGAEFLLDRVDDQPTKDALSLLFSQNLIWGPIVAHPDTPDETVTILRDAFAALATDEAFLAEAEKRLLVPVITDGAAVQALVDGIASTAVEVQDRARGLLIGP
jgi:tripartite-type tricarboxylate transporter receptor subunit TctC